MSEKLSKKNLPDKKISFSGRFSLKHSGKLFIHMFYLSVAVFLNGIGAAMMMKAELGVNAYDALSISFSQVCNLPIGTVTMLMNLLFFLLQIILLKKDTELERFLQIPLLILLGAAINFMTYEVLAGISITSYIVKISFFLAGLLLCAASCAGLMKYKIGFPLESFCLVAAQKFKWRFSRLRQLSDILCILLILLLYLVFSATISIREGTLISMLLLGPLIEISLRKLTSQSIG